VNKMFKLLKPLKFTALYRNQHGDKRKNVILTADYRHMQRWEKAFIRFINAPDLFKVIEIGHMLHDKFKNNEAYNPKLLRRVLHSLMLSGGFTDKENDEIEGYFVDLFTYTIVEIKTEWR